MKCVIPITPIHEREPARGAVQQRIEGPLNPLLSNRPNAEEQNTMNGRINVLPPDHEYNDNDARLDGLNPKKLLNMGILSMV